MKKSNPYHNKNTFFQGELVKVDLEALEPTEELARRSRGRPSTGTSSPKPKKNNRRKKR